MSEDAGQDLAVKTHVVAQCLGGRVFQCDATAVCTMPDGTHAYLLLDGLGPCGSSPRTTTPAAPATATVTAT